MKKAAIILTGSGAKDGSEIHESTMALLALSRRGIAYDIFAPDKIQADLIDHTTGTTCDQQRNCMVEAARIARGRIAALSTLDVASYDALIIPGGFGAAKNLFTYAFDSLDFGVLADFERAVREFNAQGKPIGAMCISPLSLARIFEGTGVRLTLGAMSDLAQDTSTKFGVKIVASDRREAVVDTQFRIVSTPCYMYHDATVADIEAGAEAMVSAMMRLTKQPL